ncbi:hypothetical protein HYDPIDRAFT_105600 [Hydnomerulius pinastri MD-312]|nr:hypothetical protein HYDPIDRAFT_105600 [Hydnomerulius pinastri MD-312]
MDSLQSQIEANLLTAWYTYCLSFASISLAIWDHAITFGQEVEYFWSGGWNISRVLYLTIRYLTLVVMGIYIYLHCNTPNAATLVEYDQMMDHILYVGYIGVFVLVLLCQAVVMLRVWYLFSHNRYIRIAAAAMYAASVIGSSVQGAREWYIVEQEYNSDTNVTAPTKLTQIWYIFFPCVVVHTTLFLCKIWRVLESKRSWHDAPVMRRMLKEGAMMYSFATGALLFSVIGLSETNNASIYQPALLGDFAVVATVVSVCHAMLSIKSLAAMWHVDPAWLLNHAELSRVHWRKGRQDGELVVEIGEDACGVELSVTRGSDSEAGTLTPASTITTVTRL